MKMLTWYGTIVRVERRTGAWIHAPLWPLRDTADDLALDLPNERTEMRRILPGVPPIAVQSAPTGRAVQLLQNDKFLSAPPGVGEVLFNADAGRPTEIFMPFSDGEIGRLRDIIGHGWRIVETGDVVAPGAAWVLESFILMLGRERIQLEFGVPMPDASRQILSFVNVEGRTLHARRGAAVPARDELLLTRTSPPPPELANMAAFVHAPEGSLTLRGDTEYGFLPLTARLADQAWMHARSWRADGPTLGPYQPSTRVVRQRDKFVLLTEGQEGVVFDEQGVCNEGGYLMNRFVFERGVLMRDGNNAWIDRAVLDAAPRLEGCVAVFCNGNLSNYYHWLVDALLPLFIMRPFLPEGAKLLIPGRIAALRGKSSVVDHMAALHAWGFGDMPMVEVTDPVCRAETVMWLDHVSSVNIIADQLAAARAHVWSMAGPPAPPNGGTARRIYIRRHGSRSVLNHDAVEAMLTQEGFIIAEMDAMSPRQQIDMFRGAEYVVATHGAALSNIIYCAPGTRVLEISPDREYRSLFAELSDKLGLVHAVLPCLADSAEFHGGMRLAVDLPNLGRLLRQLQSWH